LHQKQKSYYIIKIKFVKKTVSTEQTYHVHETSQKNTTHHTPKTPIKNHHHTDEKSQKHTIKTTKTNYTNTHINIKQKINFYKLNNQKQTKTPSKNHP